jgi:hypothetical protein
MKFVLTPFAMAVEHIITADDPFGEPWPPDGSCSVVHRSYGFTLWRRISIRTTAPSPVTDWRAASGDQTRAP